MHTQINLRIKSQKLYHIVKRSNMNGSNLILILKIHWVSCTAMLIGFYVFLSLINWC